MSTREKIPSEIAKEIEDAVADLRKAMGGDNVDDIKSKLDAANKAVSKIGEHMSKGSSGGGDGASGGGSQGGDQTPEADYEEVDSYLNLLTAILSTVEKKWLGVTSCFY
ncbi:hypothetical protein OIU85_001567 [Salix viminalis]|uniref:Uncharacterized protein n=1 Tax=Salix viminalis TaxID=40686 RepID=A0A9Q0ZXY9_SALVM|nr:hypothetical protein OIU85_001567 [Salix viminalis]